MEQHTEKVTLRTLEGAQSHTVTQTRSPHLAIRRTRAAKVQLLFVSTPHPDQRRRDVPAMDQQAVGGVGVACTLLCDGLSSSDPFGIAVSSTFHQNNTRGTSLNTHCRICFVKSSTAEVAIDPGCEAHDA